MSRIEANTDVFRAIADPTRRALLDRLRAGPANAGTLAADFQSSRPAVSKHLRVLREARLVVDTRIGRERVYAVNPVPLQSGAGGGGRARGTGGAAPYPGGGDFLEADPPRKLVQTWQRQGMPGTPSTLTYLLEPIAGGTRLTVRHAGIVAPEQRNGTSAGWRTSFDRLSEILPTRRG